MQNHAVEFINVPNKNACLKAFRQASNRFPLHPPSSFPSRHAVVTMHDMLFCITCTGQKLYFCGIRTLSGSPLPLLRMNALSKQLVCPLLNRILPPSDRIAQQRCVSIPPAIHIVVRYCSMNRLINACLKSLFQTGINRPDKPPAPLCNLG